MKFLIAVSLVSLLSCGGSKPAMPTGRSVNIASPLGLPPLEIPSDNPPTPETIELGRKLYFSSALSVDGTLSCANCHNPKLGFADGQHVSTGVHGKKGSRNAPTILNAAFNRTQFWDGRAANLEAQVSGPMLNSLEMGHTLRGVEASVSADPELGPLFERAFGPGAPTVDKISRAIASFERTLLSGNSPFDRYFFRGDKTAISQSAQRGFEVFRNPAKGACVECHTIADKYALFTDDKFHNLGVGLSPEGEITDKGNGNGRFRTPSLRNVALTAPYMHDGSLRTLKEVVDFYVGGGSSNPHLDPLIKPLSHLTKEERADLVSFLESLTGEVPR